MNLSIEFGVIYIYIRDTIWYFVVSLFWVCGKNAFISLDNIFLFIEADTSNSRQKLESKYLIIVN